MIFAGTPVELWVEEFWEVRSEWPQFYAICSGKIFSLNEHNKLLQISCLPRGAQQIPFVQEQQYFSQPTSLFRDRVVLVGGWFGGDIDLVLANGAVVMKHIDREPGLDISEPLLEFFLPADVIRLEIKHTADELTLFPIDLLPS